MGSIRKAAMSKRANAMLEARRVEEDQGKEAKVESALRGLEEGISHAKADEGRAKWGMHQHVLATDELLGQVRELAASRVAVGKQLRSGLESGLAIKREGIKEAGLVKAGVALVDKAVAEEAQIAKRARMAALEAGYSAGVVRLLDAKSRVLQKSAALMQRRGRGRSPRIKAMARKDMALEESASKAARSVATLQGEAREAEGYVKLLQRDIGAAKRRVAHDEGMLAKLEGEYRQQAARDGILVRDERLMNVEEGRGIEAVKANEAAFRRDEAGLIEDGKAIDGADQEVKRSEGTLSALESDASKADAAGAADARAYVVDRRQVALLQRARAVHLAASTVMGEASRADGADAQGMLEQGKAYLDLAKEDGADAKDGKRLAKLLSRRQQ
jgi:hypothetical protein